MFMRTAIDYDGPNGTRVINDLILSVVDKGDNTANVSVRVNITNVNDNPPLCSQDVYRANVTENTTYGKSGIQILVLNQLVFIYMLSVILGIWQFSLGVQYIFTLLGLDC